MESRLYKIYTSILSLKGVGEYQVTYDAPDEGFLAFYIYVRFFLFLTVSYTGQFVYGPLLIASIIIIFLFDRFQLTSSKNWCMHERDVTYLIYYRVSVFGM